ncbi:MAG TPA: type III PLP-dependent enzyme, partial [Chloroflexota bacterium]|nr:type III PLP-dependent enzyme [Chloroflexota bacterium]
MELSQLLIGAARPLETPVLLVDRLAVAAKLRQLREALPTTQFFYAVKANPHPEILAVLAAEDCGFEIASSGELELLMALGVPPCLITSSNPVKRPDFIRAASAYGVDTFAFDSSAELRKLAELAPGSRVYLRLTV